MIPPVQDQRVGPFALQGVILWLEDAKALPGQCIGGAGGQAAFTGAVAHDDRDQGEGMWGGFYGAPRCQCRCRESGDFQAMKSRAELQAIIEEIASDASPVGMDAVYVHAVILDKLMQIEARLDRLEAQQANADKEPA